MKTFANLEGLKNFRNKIERAKINQSMIDNILLKIANTSINYAYKLYNSEKVSLYSELSSNKVRIFAEGDEIAYIEFGTGERGQGSYKGNLPENQLTFYSSRFGKDIVLEYGWTYSYANKIDETQPTWSGFESQAQMWKTVQHMREIIPQIIREVVSSESIH